MGRGKKVGMKKVLIIERQLSSRELLLQLLKEQKLQLFTVEDGMSALELLKKRSFDLILSDLKGIHTLDRSNRRPLNTPIIHLKGEEDPQAMNVDHVLSKPLHPKSVVDLLAHLLKKKGTKTVVAESGAMKEVLVDQARRKGALKRGGDRQRELLDPNAIAQDDDSSLWEDILEVDACMEQFEREHPRSAQVVMLMYFGGLNSHQVAAALDLSERTVRRDWRFAQAWMSARLSKDEYHGRIDT